MPVCRSGVPRSIVRGTWMWSVRAARTSWLYRWSGLLAVCASPRRSPAASANPDLDPRVKILGYAAPHTAPGSQGARHDHRPRPEGGRLRPRPTGAHRRPFQVEVRRRREDRRLSGDRRPARPRRPPKQPRAHGCQARRTGGRRRHLALVLDEQARHRRRAAVAGGARPGQAHRSGGQVPARVGHCPGEGTPRRRRAGTRRTASADGDPRRHDAHDGHRRRAARGAPRPEQPGVG